MQQSISMVTWISSLHTLAKKEKICKTSKYVQVLCKESVLFMGQEVKRKGLIVAYTCKKKCKTSKYVQVLCKENVLFMRQDVKRKSDT
jgi:hypothetical protein